MERLTKGFFLVGGIALAGIWASSWLEHRRALQGLPDKPWYRDAWKELSQRRRDQARQEWYDKAGTSIMDDVGDLVNAMGGEKEAGVALGRGLIRQHRTLQSSFFRALPHLLNEYAANAGTDARNEHAVKLAGKLAKCTEGEFLPCI